MKLPFTLFCVITTLFLPLLPGQARAQTVGKPGRDSLQAAHIIENVRSFRSKYLDVTIKKRENYKALDDQLLILETAISKANDKLAVDDLPAIPEQVFKSIDYVITLSDKDTSLKSLSDVLKKLREEVNSFANPRDYSVQTLPEGTTEARIIRDLRRKQKAASDSLQILRNELLASQSYEMEKDIYQGILFGVAGTLIAYFFMSYKRKAKRKKAFDKYSSVHDEQEKGPLTAVSGTLLPIYGSAYAEAPAAETSPAVFPAAVNPVTVSNSKYFHGEVMVTAGPRKNFEQGAAEGDYGLGEDVAGFVVKGDKAFFWVLDGTSDSDRVTRPIVTSDRHQEEIFSSRLLAQTIGWKLQDIISNMSSWQGAANILQTAIENTRKDWQERFDQLGNGQDEYLQNALNRKNGTLQCSTTAVFGILTLDGDLDVCHVGDSQTIAYPGSGILPNSKGRMFANLQRNGNDLVLNFNDFRDSRAELIQKQGIRAVLVMTDGISSQMAAWLANREPDFSSEETRRIIAQFKQKTFDDKALCVIRIKE